MVNDSPRSGSTSGNATTTALVLVLAPFEENAKRVESHLRNAGHKMRAVWVTGLPELEQHLQKSKPDLLLAGDRQDAVPLKVVIDCCRRFAPGLPILGLAHQLSAEGTASAVIGGARDLVADGDADSLAHLERVYVRELLAYRCQRELARTRALLADYESRYSQLVAGTGDAVAHVYEGILSSVNPAFAQLLGYDDVAVLSGVPLMDVVAPDHQAPVREHLKQLINGRADGKALECALIGNGGKKVSVSALLTCGEAEGERFVEMLIRAESAQRPAVAAGPGGRIEFVDAIAVPPPSDQPRAALLAVVDGFAALEERIGCYDAEQVVNSAAAVLRRLLGASDTLYRFSTHEFGLLVSRPDANEFEQLAAAMVREVAGQVFSTADHDAQLTLSIAAYPLGSGDTPSQVIATVVREARKLSADKGGNRMLVVGPTAQANAEEREEQRKADSVRKAIADNRFKLAYQTIASLEGDTRQHFDVLLRMVDEHGTELHARDFMQAAEKAGLMRMIDRWVVGRATKIIAERGSRKDSSMLFVKLSEDTLKDTEAFLAWFQDTLKGRRLGEEELCFQIQEVVLQNHIRKAKVLTKVLRETGASVAVEHFGIGTSSAQLIEHLPINFLKFHSSYTQNFGDKDVHKKMTQLMELAKQRRIKTIVSHVEDANVMARMWQMGVNFIQGYHIQEPEVVLLA